MRQKIVHKHNRLNKKRKHSLSIVHTYQLSGLWIRIHEGKIEGKIWKNIRKLEIIEILFNCASKFGPAPWFFTFAQPFLSFSPVSLRNKIFDENKNLESIRKTN